jgi:uncharacterized protein with HEPN domain
MPRRRPPRAALEDIAEAIGLIERYLRGRTRTDLDREPMPAKPSSATSRSSPRASRRLPEAWKERHPTVPWRKVAGIGNVLRDDYDRVDTTVLWQAATVEMQTLKDAVQAMQRDLEDE